MLSSSKLRSGKAKATEPAAPPEHRDNFAIVMSKEPLSLIKKGMLAEATAACYKSLEAARTANGDQHPETLAAIHEVGLALHVERRFKDAVNTFQHLLPIEESVLGAYHRGTLATLHALAKELFLLREYEQARALFTKEMDRRATTLGPEHPVTLSVMCDVGLSLQSLSRFNEAEGFFRHILPLRMKVLGPNHDDTVNTVYFIYESLAEMGNYDRAMALVSGEYQRCERSLGRKHSLTIRALDHIARTHVLMGRLFEAESTYLEAVRLSRKAFGSEHKITRTFLDDIERVQQMQSPSLHLDWLNAIAAEHGRPAAPDPFKKSNTYTYAQLFNSYATTAPANDANPPAVQELEGSRPLLPARSVNGSETEVSQPASLSPHTDRQASVAQSHTSASSEYQIPPLSHLSMNDTDPPSMQRLSIATSSSDSFQSLVERSIRAWKSLHYMELNPDYGKYEAIHKFSSVLRGLNSMEDLLNLDSDTFWFLQPRDHFLKQGTFEQWDEASCDSYIVVPSEAGFINHKDVIFLSHYWLTKEHPDPECKDLQPLQQRLQGGYWPKAAYFWVDYTCIPQAPHSAAQRTYVDKAMTKFPALIRDSFMLWNFPRFEPRLWILFEAAQYVSTQPGRPADIEPFMTHFAEMATGGVQSVVQNYGYTCSDPNDLGFLIPLMEILVIITQLTSSVRIRRELLHVMEDLSIEFYTHEETGIHVNKSKGMFTLQNQVYVYTPFRSTQGTIDMAEPPVQQP